VHEPSLDKSSAAPTQTKSATSPICGGTRSGRRRRLTRRSRI
jgi:hypothetical protein